MDDGRNSSYRFGVRAAFFDMDRTLLRVDSGISWMRFLRRRGEVSRWGLARASYWALLYRMAVLDMESLAEKLVFDLAGSDVAEMVAKCNEWIESDLAHQVARPAEQALAHHRDRGDYLVLLTGSTQFAAEAIGRQVGIDATVCSRVEVSNGVFTGRLESFCFGRQKVVMAEQFAAEKDIDLAASCFYSDSFNDVPMLSRVGEAVAVNPDTRLLRTARKNGWRVEQWA